MQPLPRSAMADDDTVTGPFYVAASRHGRIELAALDGEPVRHAADAAIALARYADCLDALEGWIGEPLDWQWVAVPQPASAPMSPIASALFEQEADTPRLARIGLPWTLVRRPDAPPAALAARLRWPDVPVTVTIGSFAIPDEELAAIEPGGAIVLPDSLRASWRGSVRAVGEAPGAGIGAVLEGRPGSIAAKLPAAAPAAPVAGGFEVRLLAPRTLPADRLAGWSDQDLGAFPGNASLWRMAPGSPGRCIAIGRLMPWGAGAALAIETVG